MKHALRDKAYEKLAHWLGGFLKSKTYYFDIFQRHGLHILPNHFYEPIPDTRELPDTLWGPTEAPGVDDRLDEQIDLVEKLAAKYAGQWNEFPLTEDKALRDGFFIHNSAFASVDAELLYGIVRYYEPKNIIEVGSGHSTRIIGAALDDANLKKTTFTSIEPYPLDWVTQGNHQLTDVVHKKVQDVALATYNELQANDILFIDTSHTVSIGSDTVWLILQVLPRLNPGVIVHVHDIFLPGEYPKHWVKDLKIFWNEQYLVQAFLAFNQDFEILVGGSWLHLKRPELLEKHFRSYDRNKNHPASLWIRRKTKA